MLARFAQHWPKYHTTTQHSTCVHVQVDSHNFMANVSRVLHITALYNVPAYSCENGMWVDLIFKSLRDMKPTN